MIGKNFLTQEERTHLLSITKDKRETGGLVRRANAMLILDKGWTMHSF